MKSKLVVSLWMIAMMLCPMVVLAAEQEPVAVDESVMVAENPATGDVVGESAEVDAMYAPETAKEIKAEAKDAMSELKTEEKEEINDIKAEAREEMKDLKAEEKEALKEEKM